MYQLFSITFASLFPIAAITYSLMYGINNKKKVRLIDVSKQGHNLENPIITTKFRSSSIGSLLDYAEQLDEDEIDY